MTTAIVSALEQTLPLLSSAASNSAPLDGKGTSSPNTVAEVSKGKAGEAVFVDTISLSAQSRQAVQDVKNNESLSEAAKNKKVTKEESVVSDNGGNLGRATAKVLFVYDLKGELSVRYMDRANNPVYQVPSELMLQIKEAAAKPEASVDTKV